MIFENVTDLSDAFLRGMLRWSCKQVNFPYAELWQVSFGNRNTSPFSGRCWPMINRILIRTRPVNEYPLRITNSKNIQPFVNDRLALIVFITAHELQHLVNWHTRLPCGQRMHNVLTKARDLEPHCDRVASRVTEQFEQSRLTLSYSWSQ